MKCSAALAVLLLIACKSEPSVRIVAEVPGDATLVTGTRRIALRTNTSWFVPEGGKLVDKPEVAAAIAKLEASAGGVVDVFLGTTPIVSGGEEHQEKHVRIPAADVDVHGVVTEVVNAGAREAWLYEHELRTQIAFVTDKVEEAPALERIGPDAPGASPVSARLCRHPKVVDLAASPTTIYALVTECSDDAPVRVVAYPGGEQRFPTVAELGFRPEMIAVSRTGKLALVGVFDGKELASYRDTVTRHTIGVTRIASAIVDDSDRLWVLGLDAGGYRLSRDKTEISIPPRVPKALGYDDTLGVVVLFADQGTSSLHAFSR